MNTLVEATLRQLLREHILEPFHIIHIEPFETESDSHGNAMPHRDSYRRVFEGRLSRLREVAPNRIDIHEQHIAVLRALEAVEPTENLYHWTAQGQVREYFGVSTFRGIVSCFSHSRSPDAQEPAA